MDDEAIRMGMFNDEYSNNFEQKYGKVAPNQSWDLTTVAMRNRGMVRSKAPNYAATRVGGNCTGTPMPGTTLIPQGDSRTIVDGNNTITWYDVQSQTLSFLDELKEGWDNRWKGRSFVLSEPSECFYIIPIYQGEAGMKWDLHLVTGNKDYVIWKKSEGLKYWSNNNNAWEQLTEVDAHYDSDDANHTSSQINENKYNTIGKTIQATPIKIDNTKLQGDFYFYLDVTQGMAGRDDYDSANKAETDMKLSNGSWKYYAYTGSKQTSINGMMLALNTTAPTNLGSLGTKAIIIGCEDSDLDDSDWDMNDVVFMVVGNSLPAVKEVTKKRYMIEDLGSTSDFDFNDIVVDVTEEKVVMNADGSSVSGSETTQYAEIKHLCGTLPFKLKIGNMTFNSGNAIEGKGGGADGTNGYNTTTEDLSTWARLNITDKSWNPTTNNVSIEVLVRGEKWHDAGSQVFTSSMPENGDIPKIVAVDQTAEWTKEGIAINADKWQEWRALDKHENNNGNGDNSSSSPVEISGSYSSNSVNYGVQSSFNAFSNLVAIFTVPAGADISGQFKSNDGANGAWQDFGFENTSSAAKTYSMILAPGLREAIKTNALTAVIYSDKNGDFENSGVKVSIMGDNDSQIEFNDNFFFNYSSSHATEEWGDSWYEHKGVIRFDASNFPSDLTGKKLTVAISVPAGGRLKGVFEGVNGAKNNSEIDIYGGVDEQNTYNVTKTYKTCLDGADFRTAAVQGSLQFLVTWYENCNFGLNEGDKNVRFVFGWE